MKILPKFDTVGFLSNILAVILGIAITFFIQGIIDQHHEKKSVDSALQLVRDELINCRQDLSDCADFLDQEQHAAYYLQTNFKQLHSCPTDSVSTYGLIYISEMMLTLPNDALELLKTSSLFSAIDDNELSLRIIRAYDQCDALLQIFNRHEIQKTDLLKQILIEKGTKQTINSDGSFSITELMNTKQGNYLTMLQLSNTAKSIKTGLGDIDKAIAAIDQYLNQ